CEHFNALGIPCIDTDKVYHNLLIPPSKCADELADRFGREILREDKTVDRKKLASIVFSDQSGRSAEALNKISHKYVKEKTVLMLDDFRKQGKAAAVVDAPLLFEAEFEKFCDLTIAILAERELRLERIMTRDMLSREKANERISAQKPDDFYRCKASYTLYNNKECEELFSSLDRILEKENVSFDT
ncbi:MAG: dephospho-CoA kinase, partial [Clostridia bacterium]|nr:dephospho-CoA kinase [Clostridia bacterium]